MRCHGRRGVWGGELVGYAQVVHYDGSIFLSDVQQQLAIDIHSGQFAIAMTAMADTSVTVDAAWPGEPYHLEAPATVFRSGTRLGLDNNHVDADVTWACVITW